MRHLDLARFGPWGVVTGASSGIGEAFARELARRGFHLILVARRGELLERLAGALRREHGIDCRPVAIDLAESSFMDSLRRTTDELDVGLLVSNAGTATATEFVEWDAAALERDVTVNTTAHLRLAHHFGGRLASRGRGGLLLVSSIAGRQPIPYLASYAAAKSFVTVLGESLHAELRPRGVAVTVLIAGPTDTPMRTAMGFGRSRLRPMSPVACARLGLAALAKGRATYIPGARIRLMLALVPRRVIARILGRMTAEFARAASTRRLAATHQTTEAADSGANASVMPREGTSQ
jgi:short-subunit dehydrogenase